MIDKKRVVNSSLQLLITIIMGMEARVVLVFNAGAESLDYKLDKHKGLTERNISQLRFISKVLMLF